MLTIREVWQLIQQGDCAFSDDIKGTYLITPTIECHFLYFAWQNKQYH